MTGQVKPAGEEGNAQTRGRGLSAKVLVLTAAFVLIGEVLIFLPSIANFRIQWLKARVAQAEIAALAVEAAPNAIVDGALRTEILKGAGVMAVSLQRGEKRQLILRDDEHDMVEESFDLRSGRYFNTLPAALATLVRQDDRLISVVDIPPNMSGDMIQIALYEEPLSVAMRQYGLNILWLSLLLSALVAAMIYAALNRVLVKPMQRLSGNMMAFAAEPENVQRVIAPSQRQDEIGAAEHSLRDMQTQLQQLLQQKNRLAALGLAVSKVSHDLRNMLTSAQLISDRLAEVKDPSVQRFAPRLITSLDRAIGFLNQTLKYGQAQEPPPQRATIALDPLVRDVLEGFSLVAVPNLQFRTAVPAGLTVDADREQLHRVLTNLVRNSIQAIEVMEAGFARSTPPQIEILARRQGSVTEIEVRDTGPGIPEAVRGKLFEAFHSAARPGGTGLGLAIAAELIRAHAGTIAVTETGAAGTVLRISVPDQPVPIAALKSRA